MARQAALAAMMPLRIALAIESWGPGGAEKMVVQLAVALRERGHTVYPVMPQREESWLAAELLAEGFRPEWFRLRRTLDPLLIVDLVRFCRSAPIDVFHAHEFTMSVYGTAAARIAGCASVSTMHGGIGFAAAWRRRIALRWALTHAHASVAVSRSAGEFLVRACRLQPDSVQIIPNGIDFKPGSRLRVREELGLGEHELLIVAVGNLYPVKGHAVLVEALTHLDSSLPWRLAIAGRGKEEARLRELAARHGMSGRVHLLGVRSDIPDILAAADIFVMPSVSEGLPMALLEAMWAGKAIAVSAVGGIPDVIRNESTGLLVPAGDAEALATAIGRIIVEPDLRRSLGDAAGREAPARFSVGRMVDAYLAAYAGAISDAR